MRNFSVLGRSIENKIEFHVTKKIIIIIIMSLFKEDHIVSI